MLPNLANSLPIIKDRTQYEQPLPLNLSIPQSDQFFETWTNQIERLHKSLYQY